MIISVKKHEYGMSHSIQFSSWYVWKPSFASEATGCTSGRDCKLCKGQT